MAFGQGLIFGIEVTWIWLALLLFLLFRIEKPAKYYYEQGLKALDKNSPKEAISLFQSALTKQSDFPEVRIALSELYVELGDIHSAEGLLSQTIEQRFELEKSVLLLAKVYFYQNKIDDLERHVRLWENNMDLSKPIREKLSLYNTLIRVNRRALPSPEKVSPPDIFDLGDHH
ncbi:tetratricopeptide repeat protein [Alteromonadaceae bacterium M269]|nr:tetratricopeptide repeat protein [Alteromonadaceae bacterium M269]